MRVYKYPMVRSSLPQSVMMPSEAKIIHFAFQFRVPTMWAEISSDDQTVSRVFAFIGTGEETPDGGSHVATTIKESTGGVWHLYEIRYS